MSTATNLRLRDGRNVTVFNAMDFEELVKRYLGNDACEYYHDQISELVTCIECAESGTFESEDCEEVIEKYGF